MQHLVQHLLRGFACVISVGGQTMQHLVQHLMQHLSAFLKMNWDQAAGILFTTSNVCAHAWVQQLLQDPAKRYNIADKSCLF